MVQMSSRKNVLDIRKGKSAPRTKAAAPMNPLFTPRPVRLKVRRRRARLIQTGIGLAVCAVIVLALGGASHLSLFAIKNISVSGLETLTSESVVTTASSVLTDERFRFFSHKNMFTYPRAEIETTLLQAFPRIKRLTVQRESLVAQVIQVKIQEHEEFAKWCSPSDECFVLDNDGYIFMKAENPLSPYYVFRNGLLPEPPIGQTFLRGRMQGIHALFRSLESVGYAPKGLIVDSEKDFTLELEGGPKLYMSFTDDYTGALRNLETALAAEGLKEKFVGLQYVDLRFGNHVYYK